MSRGLENALYTASALSRLKPLTNITKIQLRLTSAAWRPVVTWAHHFMFLHPKPHKILVQKIRVFWHHSKRNPATLLKVYWNFLLLLGFIILWSQYIWYECLGLLSWRLVVVAITRQSIKIVQTIVPFSDRYRVLLQRGTARAPSSCFYNVYTTSSVKKHVDTIHANHNILSCALNQTNCPSRLAR